MTEMKWTWAGEKIQTLTSTADEKGEKMKNVDLFFVTYVDEA